MAENFNFTSVGANYCWLWVGDPELFDLPLPTDNEGLLDAFSPLGFYLYTVTHTGMVGVDFFIGEAPRSLTLADWETVDEIEVTFRSSSLKMGGALGDESFEYKLPAGPGRYFVRAAGRNRVEPPEPLEVPKEQYLIDIWPVQS